MSLCFFSQFDVVVKHDKIKHDKIVKPFDLDVTCGTIDGPEVKGLWFPSINFQVFRTPFEY